MLDRTHWHRVMSKAPRDGTLLLLRWPNGYISTGWYGQLSPEDRFPWKFLDRDGPVPLVNACRDDEHGPCGWRTLHSKRLPEPVGPLMANTAFSTHQGMAATLSSIPG